MCTKRVILRFVMLGLLGLLIEVAFTAIGRSFRGHGSLEGHTSLWMIFDYSMLAIVLPMSLRLRKWGIPLAGRALIYMLMIFAIEFASGWVFAQFDVHIWDYSKKPLNLYGYITLMYAPFWYALGLAAEWLNGKFDMIAWVLLNKRLIENIRAKTEAESAA